MSETRFVHPPEQCIKCGCRMLTNDEGDRWCSRVGCDNIGAPAPNDSPPMTAPTPNGGDVIARGERLLGELRYAADHEAAAVVADLTAALLVARAELLRYVDHLEGCPTRNGYYGKPCSCGLTDTLTALAATPEPR